MLTRSLPFKKREMFLTKQLQIRPSSSFTRLVRTSLELVLACDATAAATAFNPNLLPLPVGNTQAPDELFRKFRGRDPDISFMLKKKGLEN